MAMTCRQGLDDVLQRAERLIRSCDSWPPERPPSSPAVFGVSEGSGSDPKQRPQEAGDRGHPIIKNMDPWMGHPSSASVPSPPDLHDYSFSSPQKYPAGSADLAVRVPVPIATSATTETAVLIDGLERENQLLRLQVDRCFAREKQHRAELEQLKSQRDESDLRSTQYLENEHHASMQDIARFRAEAARNAARADEMAEKLADAERRAAAQAQSAQALQWQVNHAQATLESLIQDMEGLQHSLLPSFEAERCTISKANAVAEETALEKVVKQAHRAMNNLRLVVEAKIETLDLMRQQLRGNLEEKGVPKQAVGHSEAHEQSRRHQNDVLNIPKRIAPAEQQRSKDESRPQRSKEANMNANGAGANLSMYHLERKPIDISSPSSGTAALRRPAMELEAQSARDIQSGSTGKTQLSSTSGKEEVHGITGDQKLRSQLQEAEDARRAAVEEAESNRRALRVKEAEVRQLQLLGKYFPTRGKITSNEMDLAQMVDGLRNHCQQLEHGRDSLQARCEILQAERDSALSNLTMAPNVKELRDASEGLYPDLAIVQKIVEQKKAQQLI